VAPWVMSAWLAAGAAWYALMVARSVRNPFNEGADSLWALIWLAFAVLVLLSRAVMGPVLGVLPWGVGLLAVALAMAVLSREGEAVLLTIWMLALAWSLGDWLLDRLHTTSLDSRLERACLAAPLGLSLLAFLGLLLALTRNLTAISAWGLLVLLSLIRGRSFWTGLARTVANLRRTSATPNADVLPERGLLVVLLGFVALVNVAWALAPEIQYDALNYQLAVPAAYVSEHRLVNLPLFWHSYFAHMVNMVFALVLALHGPSEAKLLVFATGILAALATYALGRSLFGERVGLWAAALFYATPLVAWLSSTAYVDLPVTLFLTSSLLALLRWRTTLQAGWLRASGLLAGAALGTKLTAIYGVVALTAAAGVLLRRNAAPSVGRKAGLFGQYLLGVGLFAAPWYLIVFYYTGNPVFPMFNGIFRSPGWPPVNTNFNASLYGIGASPGSLLQIPFALTFESHRFGEALPAGGVGLALALLPIGVALAWKSLCGKRLLIAITAGYLTFWALNAQHARYYVPVLPVVCVLAVATVASSSARRDLRRLNFALLGLVVVTQVSLLFVQYWNLPERVPVRLALGAESRESFLARALPGYDAVRRLNSVARPGEKAIGAGADSMRFYVKPPLASMVESRELQTLSFPPVPARVARNLADEGYAYLLVNGVPPVEEQTYPYLTSEFLTRYATLEYGRGPVKLYRLRAAAVPPPSPENNLLDNPGLETLDSSGWPTSWIPYGRPVVIRDPSLAHDGRIAVLSTSTDGFSQPVRIRPGARYLLRHWTRTAGPGSFARLQVNWLDEWGKMLDTSIDVVPASSGWTSHETLVTAPARATTAVVYASVHVNGRVLFDDLFFAPSGPSPARGSPN
jgi:hypothetical protein